VIVQQTNITAAAPNRFRRSASRLIALSALRALIMTVGSAVSGQRDGFDLFGRANGLIGAAPDGGALKIHRLNLSLQPGEHGSQKLPQVWHATKAVRIFQWLLPPSYTADSDTDPFWNFGSLCIFRWHGTRWMG
jgi:hypothetical protein